jgi:hypothetical protein
MEAHAAKAGSLGNIREVDLAKLPARVREILAAQPLNPFRRLAVKPLSVKHAR